MKLTHDDDYSFFIARVQYWLHPTIRQLMTEHFVEDGIS